MKNSVQNDNEASDQTTSAEISRRVLGRRAFLKGALATAPLLIAGPTLLLPKKTQAAPIGNNGPSTTTEPYLVPSVPGVKCISILTVGDAIGNYRMVGIPDGLGAYASSNGNFTLLMNHELGGTSGIARGHGSPGAFVSRWIIDRGTLKVRRGKTSRKLLTTSTPLTLPLANTCKAPSRGNASAPGIWQRKARFISTA
jgi:hypothetical protein